MYMTRRQAEGKIPTLKLQFAVASWMYLSCIRSFEHEVKVNIQVIMQFSTVIILLYLQ